MFVLLLLFYLLLFLISQSLITTPTRDRFFFIHFISFDFVAYFFSKAKVFPVVYKHTHIHTQKSQPVSKAEMIILQNEMNVSAQPLSLLLPFSRVFFLFVLFFGLDLVLFFSRGRERGQFGEMNVKILMV